MWGMMGRGKTMLHDVSSSAHYRASLSSLGRGFIPRPVSKLLRKGFHVSFPRELEIGNPLMCAPSIDAHNKVRALASLFWQIFWCALELLTNSVTDWTSPHRPLCEATPVYRSRPGGIFGKRVRYG